MDEAKRALHDAICVVINLFLQPKVVHGAGVCESLCGSYLLKESIKQAPFIATIYRAFADALFEIPRTLAKNSGLDPFKTVAELKKHHLHSST